MTGTAALVGVGTELVADGRPDTNGDWLARALASQGLEVRFRLQVGDDAAEIADALRFVASRADLVIVTGGLGPTVDDLTREAVRDAFGTPLETDPVVLRELRERFARLGRTLSSAGEKQAIVPRGAVVLKNPVGSAPGLLLSLQAGGNPRTLVLLPGVPSEMERIFEEGIAPRLRTLAGMPAGAPDRPGWTLMKASGLTESEVQERILPLLEEEMRAGLALTLLASPGEITIILRSARADRLEAAAAGVRSNLGPHLFTEDPAETLESAVGARIARSGLTLAVAESCTGGLLSALLTRIPGASKWYRQGWVTYANEAKVQSLGVEEELLAAHGAVSAETASAMALGAVERSGADLGISITGIAGPDGGSADKPVGLVYVGLADRDGCRASRHLFGGSRDTIRRLAAATAMHRLRTRLADQGGGR